MRLISSAAAIELYRAMPPASETSGGSGANSMAVVASLGGRAGFISRIGQDELGDIFQHDLHAQGVSFRSLYRDPYEPTGRCLILVSHEDGERTMNTTLGANKNFGPRDLDTGMIGQSRTVLLEGYLFDQPSAKAAFDKAAVVARSAGAKVALTLSDKRCVAQHRSDFQSLVRERVDILFANEKEIMALYDVPNWDAAAAQVRGQCEVAVLTRGAQGAVILTRDQQIMVPVEKNVKAVDLTGAGDAFAGGFLWGYAQGLPLTQAGRLGALAASEVISHEGARPLVSLREFVAAKAPLARTRSAQARFRTGGSGGAPICD